jgi:mycothiol system anti-sigma-R factor
LSEIDCEHVLKEIELYLDGELDPAVSAQLDDHLSTCTPCADRSDFKRRLKLLIHERCGCDVPQDLIVKIRARLEVHPPPQ